jgi:hypothetical protein
MAETRIIKLFVNDIATQLINSIKNQSGNNIQLSTEEQNKCIKVIVSNIKKRYSVLKIKKDVKKEIECNIENICIARKTNSHRCTRQKIDNGDFCKAHTRKVPNGRYDEPIKKKIPAKRGRKRKIEIDSRQVDKNHITLWEECVNGERRLIDKNNNVYTHNIDKPVWLGKKSLDDKLMPLSEIQKRINESKTNGK